MPPSGGSGSANGWTTVPSGAGGARSARFSAIVLPVTVMQSPCSSPASSSSCITTCTPPTRSRSRHHEPARPGGRRPGAGTRARDAVEVVELERRRRASRAIASRCSTAFVDPASAITTAIAFSNACPREDVAGAGSVARAAARHRDARSRARGPRAGSRRRAGTPRRAATCPSASAAAAIVFAVYMPAHDPVGRGRRRARSASSSSSSSCPCAWAPTASNTSWIVMSRSLVRAGQDRAAVEEDRRAGSAAPSPSACPARSCRSRRS